MEVWPCINRPVGSTEIHRRSRPILDNEQSMKANILITALLIFGMVEYIYPDTILVSYTRYGKTEYSHVSRAQSACAPETGQNVYFLKDYKIVTCETI